MIKLKFNHPKFSILYIFGFSLSEILFYLLFASLILNGLVQQYTQFYRQNMLLNSQLEQSLDLEFAAELIRNSLRAAGFTPCASLEVLDNLSLSLSAIKISPNHLETERMSEDYKEISTLSATIDFLNKKFHNKAFNSTVGLGKKILVTDCFRALLLDSNSENFYRDLNYIEKNFLPPVFIGEFIKEEFFVKAEKYLYYKFKHSEKISDLIKKIEAKVVGDHYVRVKLILLTNDSLSFLVKVRNGLKI